jgi:transcriptional antiterminator RfaH
MKALFPPDFEAWYAVHCKPFKERYAASALAGQLGLTVYLPEIKRLFRGRIQYTPFFPRYLFVRTNLQAMTVRCINTTSGVIQLVAFDGHPQPIATAAIETLRQRVDQCNIQGGLTDHGFRSGDTVRLKDGPLQGLEAVFMGPMEPSERVRVLIAFLGRQREADVPVDLLERTMTAPAPRPERRTRGKGRWIKARGCATQTER